MKTDRLRINQLGAEAYAWYLAYLAAMDAKNVDRYGQFLAPQCTMQFNSEVPTEGKAAILDRLAAYWRSFGAIEHNLLNIYGSDTAFMLEALNVYTRLDGRPVSCRAVALTDCDSQRLVTSVRLYTDVSALFS